MKIRDFGKAPKGAAKLYTLDNGRMQVDVTDYGATLVAIRVLDKTGAMKDVILGYDDAEGYASHGGYLGRLVGRNANRIAGAKCMIDGKEYRLTVNDNDNNLHNGPNGLDSEMFKVRVVNDSKIVMSVFSAHMSQEFPGNLLVSVTYEITDYNELVLTYDVKTDEPTVANFTNHAYFNLNGHNSGSILGHTLKLFSSAYTPVHDNQAIPTGEIAPVEGTVFDFREPKTIGQDIGADEIQLKYVNGYDHNFVVDGLAGALRPAACAVGDVSGIRMEVYTDLPGIQLYAGNFIDVDSVGKEGAVYNPRHGFCLETQFFPDAINQPNFIKPVIEPGESFITKTIYKFSV